MLWTIDGTPHRILGSIHFHPPGVDLPEWVHRSYKGSRRIYFEDDAARMGPLLELGIDRTGAHLRFPGSQGIYDRAAEILASIGNQTPFDEFRPWRASMLVGMTLVAAAHGVTPDAGVESTLKKAAASDGVSVSYLESPGRAFELLESSVEADGGIGLLDQIVRDRDLPARVFGRTLAAWRAADRAGLAAIQSERIAQFPTILGPLFYGRNHEWLPEILRAIPDDTPTLFVVGAGHLVGDESVIRLLGDAGVTTTFEISNG